MFVNMKPDKTEILKKLYAYCAYQERSTKQIEDKLLKMQVDNRDWSDILEHLKEEKFLDEKRFAVSAARGRFYQKKWGKLKITQLLKDHQINEQIIQQALSEIPKEDYLATIENLIVEKQNRLKEDDPIKALHKTYTFLLSKGYEPEYVLPILKRESSG